MDPMKPACNEPNDILPSLKDSLEFDLRILDRYFEKKASSEDYKDRGAAVSWANVREAAISFAEMFDKQKDTTDISEGG